jgi:hypothetical protein
VTYTVRTGNTDPIATGCDIDGVTVTLTLPNGNVVTLQTNGVYPFVTPVSDVGSAPYAVNLNDAVASLRQHRGVPGDRREREGDEHPARRPRSKTTRSRSSSRCRGPWLPSRCTSCATS